MIQTLKNSIKFCIQSLLNNALIYNVSSKGNVVALTFDDGPNLKFTPVILEVLRRNGVKATFFLISSEIEKYPDMAKQIIAEGHAVGLHSYDHPGFASMGTKQRIEDVLRSKKVFEDVLGISISSFRPPGGNTSLGCLLECMKRSIKTILWTVDSQDSKYKSKGEAFLRDHLNNLKFRKGDIVLLHDDTMGIVNVLQELIDKIKRDGFRFITIGQ